MATNTYPSDMTDAEWRVLALLLPSSKPGGRPRSVNLRRILNGLFYLVHVIWLFVTRKPSCSSRKHNDPISDQLSCSHAVAGRLANFLLYNSGEYE